MSDNDCIVGIDLGTTNSEIAAFHEGDVRVIGKGNAQMLPSCVGITPEGDLLVGEAARNQLLLYPERTVRSVKRRMGATDDIILGGKRFKPQEISSLILRELMQWARDGLGHDVSRAVITVPAYFSDAQRQATREAGMLAGLEVMRILNEPTAASLAYGFAEGEKHTAMVYDLGGGTFDVSIIAIEGEVTEVLASHGNNQLGGDDFDALLAEQLARQFQEEHGVDLRHDHPIAWSRLWRAAEDAKLRLSVESSVTVREESLVTEGGVPRHLEREVSRAEFERLIEPLIESTLDSVTQALNDAGKRAHDLDAVLLVGGSTRIPMIGEIIEERVGLTPRQDVHPDLCVALGAGVLASRLAGHDISKVLVDVTPYTFGIECVNMMGDTYYHHCFSPLIKRNRSLPITRSNSYWTHTPFQTEARISIFQGDDPDALKNIPVGDFLIEGLTPMEQQNEIICRMALDLDGILKVTAVEKCTGKETHIVIENAMRAMTDAEIAAARKRLEALYQGQTEATFDANTEAAARKISEAAAAKPVGAKIGEAQALIDRANESLENMHDDDKEEAIDLCEQLNDAIANNDAKSLASAMEELKELLFYVEGR